MRYLLLDAAAGIGVLATITLSARRAPQKRSRHIRALGWVLVAGPLPLAVALHAAGRLPPTADQVDLSLGCGCLRDRGCPRPQHRR